MNARGIDFFFVESGLYQGPERLFLRIDVCEASGRRGFGAYHIWDGFGDTVWADSAEDALVCLAAHLQTRKDNIDRALSLLRAQEKRKMKFIPMYDRVLVKRIESDSVSKGGIIIPDVAKEKPLRGVVIDAGQGRRQENGDLLPLVVKSGDEVLFGKFAGTEIQIEGETFVILREDDILGIVEK